MDGHRIVVARVKISLRPTFDRLHRLHRIVIDRRALTMFDDHELIVDADVFHRISIDWQDLGYRCELIKTVRTCNAHRSYLGNGVDVKWLLRAIESVKGLSAEHKEDTQIGTPLDTGQYRRFFRPEATANAFVMIEQFQRLTLAVVDQKLNRRISHLFFLLVSQTCLITYRFDVS